MRKAVKIWLIVASALLISGCVILGIAMAVQKWDFTKLSTMEYETNEHRITEGFKAISVNTNIADVKLIPSESAECSVVCREQSKMKHTVAVADGTLTVNVVDTRKWYERIGIMNIGMPEICLYIPAGEYDSLSVNTDTGDVEISKDFKISGIDVVTTTGDVKNYSPVSDTVKINTTTGSILVENTSVGTLDLTTTTGKVTASAVTCEGDATVRVTTGKVSLTDVTCRSLISNGDTGDMILKKVIASERISVERSTGDVSFEGCDASEIFVLTSTGDIEGSLLSEKVFVANTDTGRKDVPNTSSGGRCELTTATGDIRIRLE